MKPDDQLCYCFHVTRRKIENFIRVHQPLVPSQISECGGAGTGCGWCVPFLRRLFDASRSTQAATVPGHPEADLTIEADQYASQRAAYVRSGKGKPPAGA